MFVLALRNPKISIIRLKTKTLAYEIIKTGLHTGKNIMAFWIKAGTQKRLIFFLTVLLQSFQCNSIFFFIWKKTPQIKQINSKEQFKLGWNWFEEVI